MTDYPLHYGVSFYPSLLPLKAWNLQKVLVIVIRSVYYITHQLLAHVRHIHWYNCHYY